MSIYYFQSILDGWRFNLKVFHFGSNLKERGKITSHSLSKTNKYIKRKYAQVSDLAPFFRIHSVSEYKKRWGFSSTGLVS